VKKYDALVYKFIKIIINYILNPNPRSNIIINKYSSLINVAHSNIAIAFNIPVANHSTKERKMQINSQASRFKLAVDVTFDFKVFLDIWCVAMTPVA